MDKRVETELKACESTIDKYLRSQYSNEVPRVAYHYTSWEGVKGILEKRCIWATHYRDLKDPSEGTVADAHVYSVLDELLLLAKPAVRPVLEYVRKKYGRLKLSAFSETRFDLHIACFCVEAERERLWREFGRCGRGYCLGLSVTDEDYPDGRECASRTVPVEYDPEKQRAAVRALFCGILEIARRYKSATHPKMRKLVAVRLLMEAAAANVRFKGMKYSDEKEWRLVVMLRSPQHGLETVPGTERRVAWPLRWGQRPVKLDSIYVGARNDQAGVKRVAELLDSLGYGGDGMPPKPRIVLSTQLPEC